MNTFSIVLLRISEMLRIFARTIQPETMETKYDVFISYSRADLATVKGVKEEIERSTGARCWMDLEGIESGEQFKKVIIAAINRSDTMLFMMSNHSIHSEWALDELDFAKRKKKRVVLVSIDETEMTDDFYFTYHKYDLIDWNSLPQRNKLLRDIKHWFIKPVFELKDNGKTTKREGRKKRISQLKKRILRFVKKYWYFPICLGVVFLIVFLLAPSKRTYDRGVDYYNQCNYSSAIECFLEAAEQGDAEAQNRLGLMYENGEGGSRQNYTEAVKWFRKAAELGNASAQTNIGRMYLDGLGVEQNYKEALKWFQMAAEQEYSNAQNYLGYMYERGWGVERNDTAAVMWYRKGAWQGNDVAQYNLGLMYEEGRGVQKNDTEAVRWFGMAARQGNMYAQYSLGRMYQEGQGVPQSDTKAARWYNNAAAQGNASAQYSIGWMYFEGEGVVQSDSLAVEWFRKAAEQGIISAQYMMGIMCEYGRGVQQNNEEALKWYRKAAAQGEELAKNKVKEMSPVE